MSPTPEVHYPASFRNLENRESTGRSGDGFDQPVEYHESTSGNTCVPEDFRGSKADIPRFCRWHRHRQKTDWWFASTAIPLLAATLGPLANVSSIAALVGPWREEIVHSGPAFNGVPIEDPAWCYWLNVASLICGFLGNIFLLLNFTQRIRYLIALPATIILWYISSSLLIAITSSLEIYNPPSRPNEGYTQGYWYAIGAAAFYLICSMTLMINMLGHWLGHYPDTFELTDSQRTLILQTMMFFAWLAGGAAVFSTVEEDANTLGWSFTDALYFCDVTVLTIGFGDLHPSTNKGRGLILPYSVGGIIILSLVVTSIHRSVRRLGTENIVHKHVQHLRERTLDRTVNNSFDLRQGRKRHHHHNHHGGPSFIRKGRQGQKDIKSNIGKPLYGHSLRPNELANTAHFHGRRILGRAERLILMREEKDRFEAMRRIQQRSHKFKQWGAMSFALIAFAIVWLVGAIVFWQCEKSTQGMNYFEALYFSYISLLTIGYGDIVPKSHAGRCFFVLWSVFSVPIMTVLVADMGNTVVSEFNRLSSVLADFTILPKAGIWDSAVWLVRERWGHGKGRYQHAKQNKSREKRPAQSSQDIDAEIGATGNSPVTSSTATGAQQPEENTANTSRNPDEEAVLTSLAREAEKDAAHDVPSSTTLSRALAAAIQLVAGDLHLPNPKKYSYEEWVEFSRLLRLSGVFIRDDTEAQRSREEKREDDGALVEWDWLGEDSPLVSEVCESQWILDRLCEALVRVQTREGRREGRVRAGEDGQDGLAAEEGSRALERRDSHC